MRTSDVGSTPTRGAARRPRSVGDTVTEPSSHPLAVVVLAAGGGTRMKSKTMKVLHPLAGRSMIGHVLSAVQAVDPHRVVAVVGNQREQVGPHIEELLPGAVLAVQETQDGT